MEKDKDKLENKNLKKTSPILAIVIILLAIALVLFVGFYSHGEIAKEIEEIETHSKISWVSSQSEENSQKEDLIDSSTLNDYIIEINTANAAMDSGEYDEAIESYLAAIDIDPNEESAYIGLAHAYKNNGEKTKALETLKNAYAKFKSDRLKNLLESFG